MGHQGRTPGNKTGSPDSMEDAGPGVMSRAAGIPCWEQQAGTDTQGQTPRDSGRDAKEEPSF